MKFLVLLVEYFRAVYGKIYKQKFLEEKFPKSVIISILQLIFYYYKHMNELDTKTGGDSYSHADANILPRPFGKRLARALERLKNLPEISPISHPPRAQNL